MGAVEPGFREDRGLPPRDVTFEEFMARLSELPRREFKPFVLHNPAGDMVEAWWEHEEGVAVPLNDSITLRVSAEDRSRVIGVVIHGISGVVAAPPSDDGEPGLTD